MKKEKEKKGSVLWTLLIIPCGIVFGLALMLCLPFDYLKFRFSHYRKDMKEQWGKRAARYTPLDGMGRQFNLYELAKKSGVPLAYFQAAEDEKFGYFLYKGALLVCDMVPHYNEASHSWYIVQRDDPAELEALTELAKADFEACAGPDARAACHRVVYLVKEKELYNEDKAHLAETDFILAYRKKQFAEQINAFFASEHPSSADANG